ncbi:MAG TPA: TlpA disulfide reductase family protein [Vicinamibacteria bacterium]
MNRTRAIALFAAVAVASAAGGAAYFLWPGREATAIDRSLSPQAVVERVYAARLADLQGAPQALGQWRGEVLVVNFWATWCAPCREEIPGFVNLQERYRARGLRFVGIALDQPDKVAEFAREFRVNYPLLMGGLETMELLRQTGNRAGVLPYTLVIDRKGNLVSREPGGLKEARLEGLIQPLL